MLVLLQDDSINYYLEIKKQHQQIEDKCERNVDLYEMSIINRS